MVTVSISTSIGEEFSVGSSMILEVKTLVDGLENFFSKHFYRISVLVLLLISEVLE